MWGGDVGAGSGRDVLCAVGVFKGNLGANAYQGGRSVGVAGLVCGLKHRCTPGWLPQMCGGAPREGT